MELFNLEAQTWTLPASDSPATPVAARKSVVNASSQRKGDAMSSGTATVASRTLSPSLTRSPARFLFWTVPPPSFKGDIVTPDDPGYSGEIAQWAVNAERPAGIVAFVKDTNDIALTLEYAWMNNLQIAIRCGSHSPSGASSTKGGLVIALFR